MRTKLLWIILCIVGPILTYTGYQSKALNERLQTQGETVDGEIVGGEWKSGRRSGKTYSFDVAFKPKTGTTVNQRIKVGETYFKAHVVGDAISDPVTKVRYNPENPEECIIEGEGKDQGFLMYVGPVLGLVGLAGVVSMFRKQSE